MASKFTVFTLVIAASCIMAAVSASPYKDSSTCSSRVLSTLESMVEICARDVPSMQFYDPTWQCARQITSQMKRQSSCDLSIAPGLLQSCLRDAGYIGQSYITPAVTCIQSAIDNGICC